MYQYINYIEIKLSECFKNQIYTVVNMCFLVNALKNKI